MTSLPQSSLANALTTPPKSWKADLGTVRMKTSRPTVGEDLVRDRLKSLNMHKSMGPDEIHPRVLKELVN